jgi:methylphosphotriester-DNA--protein-cysteine methyltransferase
MPNWPVQKYRDSEIVLPEARSDAFWLHSAVWQFPNFENAELFVEKLAQADMLAHDTLVKDVLQDRPPDLTARTIRHRFRRATGLTQSQIRQYERAQQAVRLLKQGASILDTVFDSGYFDQPHLTRALKHWIGYTPAEYANTIQAP